MPISQSAGHQHEPILETVHLPRLKTPYSDQELELLVEGFVFSMSDVADWNQMVKEIGEIKATVPNCAARSGLFKMFYVRWLLDYKRKRI